MAGDDDLVPLSHTAAFFAGPPEAQLAIVPGASHALPIEHPKEVVGLIERFLGSDVRDVPKVSTAMSRANGCCGRIATLSTAVAKYTQSVPIEEVRFVA